MKKIIQKKIQKNVEKHKVSKNKKGISFPMDLLKPVGEFLSSSLHILQKRKKQIEKDDPFKDEDRVMDNASPDTDAAEQFGHAKNSAIKHELERKIEETKKALARLNKGKYGICEDCGELIDTDRLSVFPEATYCKKCQAKRER